MTEIEFLPVCSNCHHVLYNMEINYNRDWSGIDSTWNTPIAPNICPYCKDHFYKITIPTKLPFIKEIEDVSFYE